MAAERGLPQAILVAARNEEERIAGTLARLRDAFPGAAVVVADDGSRDRTAERAREAGAIVISLGRRGKGEALSAAERAAPPGAVLLCDADLEGDLRPLAAPDVDVAIARFAARLGGGFGIVKRLSGLLITAMAGFQPAEPLSGQRRLSPAARAACFPLAPGFGCETRMTIDAVRAGLSVEEIELDLGHRPTGRDLAGFAHRGRQLADILLACGPLRCNYRGRRLPLVGWTVALAGLRAPSRLGLAVAGVALVGFADDLWSGPERGVGAHLRAGRTTGVAKLVGIPAVGLAATRSPSGALLTGLAANALNQLDTRPGRTLKAFLLASLLLRGAPGPSYAGVAVILLPYDLRERAMLGDMGSNALGAVLGLRSVTKVRGPARWGAVVALAGLNLLGERRSLGELIERTPVLREVDRLGRVRG